MDWMVLELKFGEMHVIGDINARRKELKWSVEGIAEKLNKSPSTVTKQLNHAEQCTLFTAYEYAELLGGGVHFITDADMAVYRQAYGLRDVNACLAAEVETLKAQNAAQGAELEAARAARDEYRAKSDAQSKRIDALYDRNDALNARNDELKAKVEELREKLAEALK